MTTQERKEVYQKCLADHKGGSKHCLCVSLILHTPTNFPNNMEAFPELSAQEPKDADVFWWPRNEEGRLKRIEALENAIALIDKNLENEH